MELIRVLPIFLSGLIVIQGCSSSDHSIRYKNSNTPQSLYLRGDMSNWSASPDLIVQPQRAKYFTAQTSLKANQTYHFKFADKDWTPSLNFGAASDQTVLSEGKAIPIAAYSCLNELAFTPEKDGVYLFILDLTGKRYEVKVEKK